MNYKMYIEQEKTYLASEEKKVNNHKKWIEIAEKYKDCPINWALYWSRYRHNEEKYTPENVIRFCFKEEDKR